MIPFADIHQHARDLIAAHAYFSGESVLVDLGASDAARESALSARGFCISIMPLIRGDTKSQVGGRSVIEVTILVLTQINPEINPTGANKNIYSAMSAVNGSLLAFSDVTPDDRYRTSPENFELFDFDPGLLAYIQTFTKLCVF